MIMKNKNYDEIALRTGAFLKRKLKETGMTLGDVADELGYSERQVGRWANGQAQRFDTVTQIAYLFDVSVWDVLATSEDVSCFSGHSMSLTILCLRDIIYL
jgi:transcriptional regulator with XRE-family HTH domain